MPPEKAKAPDPTPAVPPSSPVEPIIGGPETPLAPPSTKKVKLAGREFDVPADIADAVAAREQEFSRKLSEQSDELGRLRRTTERPAPVAPTPAQPQQPDWNDLWFTDPAKAAQLIEARVEQRLEQRYVATEAFKEFWDGFYRTNQDLREDDFVVRALFAAHQLDLLPLTPKKAQERLAELTREELLRVAQKFTPKPSPSVPLESPSGPRSLASPAEEEGPKSLSEVIRARRQRRLGAVAKTG